MDTLKVRMNVSLASADWSFAPGDEIELDTDLANAWLESGHATSIKGEKADKTTLPDGVDYLGFGRFMLPNNNIVSRKSDVSAAYDAWKSEVGEETATTVIEDRARAVSEAAAEATAESAAPSEGASETGAETVAETVTAEAGDVNGSETGDSTNSGTGDTGSNEGVSAG